MKVLFVKGRQVYLALGCLLLLVLTIGLVLNRQQLARKIYGVKAGVSLAGMDLSGMLPNEVTELVKGIAIGVNREPCDASFFSETGEILPARSGQAVQVAATVNRVCLARFGETVELLVEEIQPNVSEDFFKPIYHGNPDLPKVALAINVAWGEEFLIEILKTLQQEKVNATFFFVGTWVKSFPELVREIAAAGHEIANHGSYHGHPLQMNREDLKKLINDNEELLQSVTGGTPAKLFAPPYGEVNQTIAGVAGEMGYRTVMWSVDTIDWKNPGPELLLKRVLTPIDSGGIILMHPTVSTMKALPILIRELRKKGLEPGTVSGVLQY